MIETREGVPRALVLQRGEFANSSDALLFPRFPFARFRPTRNSAWSVCHSIRRRRLSHSRNGYVTVSGMVPVTGSVRAFTTRNFCPSEPIPVCLTIASFLHVQDFPYESLRFGRNTMLYPIFIRYTYVAAAWIPLSLFFGNARRGEPQLYTLWMDDCAPPDRIRAFLCHT